MASSALQRKSLEIAAAPAARGLALGFLAGLCGAAGLFAARRFAGALVHPLDSVSLLFTGLFAASACCVIRWLWRKGATQADSHWLAPLLAWGPAVGVVSLAASLSLPKTSPLGLVFLWGALLAEEAWSLRAAGWRDLAAGRPSAGVRATALERTLVQTDTLQQRDMAGDTADNEAFDDAFLLDRVLADKTLLQQVSRSRTTEGVETLHAWLKASFQAGQLRTSVHLAFCPPFERTPEVDFEQSNGPDAQIQLGQLLAYGVRLDVKLDAPSVEPVSVLIELAAHV